MKASAPHIEYRIKVKPNKTEGVLNYDEDNKYPQRVRELVKSSGTASNCVKTYAKFIRGGGFKDKAFYNARINRKGGTPDKLLREISKDMSLWQGFAWLIKYDLMQNPIEVYSIPFEFCRLGDPDTEYAGMIAVYDDWDRQKSKNIYKDKIDWIEVYNPDKNIIREQMDAAGGPQYYKGQILWYSADKEYYPLAIYDPVLEDIETNAGIKTFRLRNTKTCFLGSKMIELPYEFQEEEEREEFIGELKKFQGVDSGNRMFLAENPSADTAPIKITDLESKDNDKMFETTNQTSKDSIVEAFSMPPILAGIQVAGKLGNRQELQDAREYYDDITSDERLVIEEKFFDVFRRFSTVLNPSGDYSIIPLSVASVSNLTAQ